MKIKTERMVRTMSMDTGESTEWSDVGDEQDTLIQLMNVYEMMVQTLAWENGGSLTITRERFERAYEQMVAAHGENIVPQIALSSDMMYIELVDSEKFEPIKGHKA